MLLLTHAVAEKIMILRTVLRKISCHAARKKQRDLRNRGNLKTAKAGNQKNNLKENENNTGQITLLDIYYIWMEKMMIKNKNRDDEINEVSSKGSRMTLGQTALAGALSTAKTVAVLISSYQIFRRQSW